LSAIRFKVSKVRSQLLRNMLRNTVECASFRINIAAMAAYPKPGWPETIAIETAFEGRYLRDG